MNVKEFGVPCVVAANRFPTDTDEEVALLQKPGMEYGAHAAVLNDGFVKGGAGAAEMAEAVADACEQPSSFNFIYDDADPIDVKIEKICTRIYRADGVDFLPVARQKIEQFTKDGLTGLSICMAKTHLSLSADPALANAPTGFRIPVRDIRPYTGAGFLTALCGDIMQMPGLGKTPPASTSTSTRTGRLSDSSSSNGTDPYLHAEVGDFLDSLADRTPAPGGGAAAALTCAMAAALVEMATSFASARGLERVHDRAALLRSQVQVLAYADGKAYGIVLQALKILPGDARQQSLDAAVAGAIACPLNILDIASEVATLAADVAETCTATGG